MESSPAGEGRGCKGVMVGGMRDNDLDANGYAENSIMCACQTVAMFRRNHRLGNIVPICLCLLLLLCLVQGSGAFISLLCTGHTAHQRHMSPGFPNKGLPRNTVGKEVLKKEGTRGGDSIRWRAYSGLLQLRAKTVVTAVTDDREVSGPRCDIARVNVNKLATDLLH